MKRFFAMIVVFLFLFLTVAPVFSLAAYAPYNFASAISSSVFVDDVYILNPKNTDICYSIGYSVTSGTVNSASSSLLVWQGNVGIAITFNGTANSTISYVIQYINLLNGNITNRSYTNTLNSNGTLSVSYAPLPFSNPVYYYCYQNRFTKTTVNNTSYTLVEQFVNFPPSNYSNNVVNSSIPEPHATDRIYYLADYQYLYQFCISAWYGNELSNTNNVVDTEYDWIQFYIEGTSSPNNFNIDIYFDRDAVAVNRLVYVNKYSLAGGYFISSQAVSFPATSSGGIIPIELNQVPAHGIYVNGNFIIDNIQCGLLKIRWSDTLDYSTDFQIMEQYTSSMITVLNNLYSMAESINATQGTIINYEISLNDYIQLIYNKINHIDTYVGSLLTELLDQGVTLDNISSTINSIKSRLDSFYDLSDAFYSWVKNTLYPNMRIEWTTLNNYFDRLNTTTSSILTTVNNIYSSLFEHRETEPDTSAFNENISDYEEGESYIVNQADVALDDLESQMSAAGDVLTVNSRGLLFVKNIFETFAFSGMNYYYMLFVLVIGSVALLIGRRLR